MEDQKIPEIITIFINKNDETIWLPTLNYFGEVKSEETFYLNIEEEEKN